MMNDTGRRIYQGLLDSWNRAPSDFFYDSKSDHSPQEQVYQYITQCWKRKAETYKKNHRSNPESWADWYYKPKGGNNQ